MRFFKKHLRFKLSLLLIVMTVLAVVLGIIASRAASQREAVRQLLEYDFVTIEYLVDGEQEEVFDIDDAPNRYIYSVNVVRLDLTWDEVTELIPILRKLPGLSKIVLSFQGDFEEVTSKHKQLRQAFPGLEIEFNQYIVKAPIVG